ncbi:MAG: M14 family metallopeptidase, partial [Planctomycetota bacterium]
MYYFPDNYTQAQQKFIETVQALGTRWSLSRGVQLGESPQGEKLETQVAICHPDGGSNSLLVLSTGLHGVEAFFGSAVLLALLNQWSQRPPACRVVLLHSLNPFGYANLRRTDDRNVDLNRSFRLDKHYAGSHELYSRLNGFLNPPSAPKKFEWDFLLRAANHIRRHGFGNVQQAIASGQYDFPKGLFYGGNGPSPLQKWLEQALLEWGNGSEK